MREIIVIGLGHAWKEFYVKAIEKLAEMNLVKLCGTVHPAVSDPAAEGLPYGKWHARTIHEIPQEFSAPDVVPIILTRIITP